MLRRLLLIALLGAFAYVSKDLLFASGKVSDSPVLKEMNSEKHDAGDGDDKSLTAPALQESQGEPANEETPLVEIDPERQRLIGVRVVEASVKPLRKIIRTVGRIEYDERRLATVNTKVEGWIEKLHVNYTGRFVSKGERLAEIYSPELISTQEELLSAVNWMKKAGSGIGESRSAYPVITEDAVKLVEAARQRLRFWDISESQIRGIEESGQAMKTLTVFSPARGYIIQKMAIQGMRVMPGEKLFDVADLSSVWVIADIYEFELSLVGTGQKARITLSYFPGKEFISVIDYVYPALSMETKTAKIRFTVPNPDGELKPLMFTNVEIKIDLGSRLVIPEDSVIDTGTRQIVYVDAGDGYFEPRQIRIGLKSDGHLEVLDGLKSGEKVAASATFLIDSEAQLKGIKPLQKHTH